MWPRVGLRLKLEEVVESGCVQQCIVQRCPLPPLPFVAADDWTAAGSWCPKRARPSSSKPSLPEPSAKSPSSRPETHLGLWAPCRRFPQRRRRLGEGKAPRSAPRPSGHPRGCLETSSPVTPIAVSSSLSKRGAKRGTHLKEVWRGGEGSEQLNAALFSLALLLVAAARLGRSVSKRPAPRPAKQRRARRPSPVPPLSTSLAHAEAARAAGEAE